MNQAAYWTNVMWKMITTCDPDALGQAGLASKTFQGEGAPLVYKLGNT
jgi:hypothetical protein